jgi:hypothetical protein
MGQDDSFYTEISAEDIMLHLTQFEAISKQYNDSRSIDLVCLGG